MSRPGVDCSIEVRGRYLSTAFVGSLRAVPRVKLAGALALGLAGARREQLRDDVDEYVVTFAGRFSCTLVAIGEC